MPREASTARTLPNCFRGVCHRSRNFDKRIEAFATLSPQTPGTMELRSVAESCTENQNLCQAFSPGLHFTAAGVVCLQISSTVCQTHSLSSTTSPIPIMLILLRSHQAVGIFPSQHVPWLVLSAKCKVCNRRRGPCSNQTPNMPRM